MAQPNVIIYAKTEGTGPGRHSTNSSLYITVTNTQSLLIFGDYVGEDVRRPNPVLKPKTGIKLVPGAWVHHNSVSTFFMAFCTATAYRQFAVRFYDYACTRKPRLTAWDKGSRTTEGIIFQGTPVSTNASLLRAINACKAAASNTYWVAQWYNNSQSVPSGGNNVYLKGDESYLTTFTTGASEWNSANGEFNFNIAILCPSDLSHNNNNIEFDLEFIYYYS